jgi:hypothetical protein
VLVADQVSDLGHGRFQRAIRNLRRGAMAARELGRVSLTDPLALTLAHRVRCIDSVTRSDEAIEIAGSD